MPLEWERELARERELVAGEIRDLIYWFRTVFGAGTNVLGCN